MHVPIKLDPYGACNFSLWLNKITVGDARNILVEKKIIETKEGKL